MNKMDSQNRWRRWIMMTLGWTLVGLFFSTQIYLIFTLLEKKTVSWWYAIRSTVPDWYVWALFALVIVPLSRRLRVEKVGWRLAVLIHFIASLVFSILHIALAVSVLNVFETMSGHTISWIGKFRVNFLIFFHWDVLTYWAIVAFSLSIDYYRSFQERKMKAMQLETQLAEAQLQLLKMQLHPHFLFNTLNSISVLINSDTSAARKMISRLSDFLRLTLRNSKAQEILLRQELEFLQCYLEIEKVRFQDRLIVDWQVDESALEIPVPNLILQPIVENAITHGVSSQPSTGRILIRAVRENGLLRLEIKDNGAGISAADSETGIGLTNTAARLKYLYGDENRLRLTNLPEGGTLVTLEIPVRME